MFFGAFELSHGELLKCGEFRDYQYYLVGTYYSCVVTSFENLSNNMIIIGHTGLHKPNKDIYDVKAIHIHDTNTKFIPAFLGYVFFLTAFYMERTQLVQIKAKDFTDMHSLEVLSLYENKLTSLPLDAFSILKALRIIILSRNQIEELSNGLFSNNVNLEHIYLYGSKIKFIGPGLFDGLTKLNKVDLDSNICISKLYEGRTAVTQLKFDVKLNCKHSK